MRHLQSNVVAVLGILCAVNAVAAAEVKIEEKVVGPAWEQGITYTLSPNGLHLATAGPKGSRFVVTVDGVEGEKFDEILQAASDVTIVYGDDGYPMAQQVKRVRAVAFSPDGLRHAYAARAGKDVIVILDGKECFRGPYYAPDPNTVGFLSFTPDGKHLLFQARESSFDHFKLMMDGKPVTPGLGAPWYATNQPPYPFFSADGARWGLFGNKPKTIDGGGELFLMIDGKDVGYTSRRVMFTPDGKHVVCDVRAGDAGKSNALLVDGQPILTVPSAIDRFMVSSSGDIAAIASAEPGKKQLYLNGNAVSGTENIQDVIFSPDGKHWAARCASSPSWYVVVDGKKQQSYDMVHAIAFTPDSSKCVYLAQAGAKEFVVTNGEEDNGSQNILVRPMFGKSGNHIAYCARNGSGKFSVIHDGKTLPECRSVNGLTLSPDGARYAYYSENHVPGSYTPKVQLIVDGEAKDGGRPYNVLFSPDSKHVAAMSSATDGKPAIYLDGQFVPIPKGLEGAVLQAFTPDSQHLLIKGNERSKDGSKSFDTYYLDGQRVAQFQLTNRDFVWPDKATPTQLWEIQSDSSVVVVGAEAIETAEGPMKRVNATPAPGTSIATWIADLATAQAKAIADAAQAKTDAEAAQAKAAADAAQARADAAKAKADAAKAKADARAKASADAAAARLKARADADAARKAKQAK
jgi:hypothetical protein